MFLGFYNYTVWLTYFSLVSGILGIIVSLSGGGHPYLGTFFLLFSGLCDAYDGKVARMKKVRTEEEKAFGIQIDFLAVTSSAMSPASVEYPSWVMRVPAWTRSRMSALSLTMRA